MRLTVVGTGALSWAEMRIRRFDRRAVDDLAFGARARAAGDRRDGRSSPRSSPCLIPVTPASPLPPTGTIGGLLLQLLVGAVIAPIAEEILFRGFAMTAWERSIGAQRAIVRASLLFALAHVINASGDSLGEVAGLVVVGMATRLPVAFVAGLGLRPPALDLGVDRAALGVQRASSSSSPISRSRPSGSAESRRKAAGKAPVDRQERARR